MKKAGAKGKPTLQWVGITSVNIDNDRWVATPNDAKGMVVLEKQVNAKAPALGRSNLTWYFSYDDLETVGMECVKRVFD